MEQLRRWNLQDGLVKSEANSNVKLVQLLVFLL